MKKNLIRIVAAALIGSGITSCAINRVQVPENRVQVPEAQDPMCQLRKDLGELEETVSLYDRCRKLADEAFSRNEKQYHLFDDEMKKKYMKAKQRYQEIRKSETEKPMFKYFGKNDAVEI